jgi:hypothetical protein
MIRILLHPTFLDYLKTTSLLESSAGTLFKETGAKTDEPQMVWLSDDDLCIMWKLVLKSKINRLPHGHRLENFTWRLWHLAQSKRREYSSFDSNDYQALENMSIEHCNLSIKGYDSNSGMDVTPMTSLLQANNRALNNLYQPSKSFAPTHEFSLMSLDISCARTGTNSSMSTLTSVDDYLSMTTTEDGHLSESSLHDKSIAKSSKKKKNVDRYLKKQRNIFGHDNLEKIEEQKEESRRNSITSATAASVLISPPLTLAAPKPTPEIDKIAQIPTKSGVAARKVSRGFFIPTRKSSTNGSISNSEKSSHISATHLSSISYEESFAQKSNSLNNDSTSPTYRIRKQSFSRSVSPNTNRPAASMLTILMNGQLTTASHFSHRNNVSDIPPCRPSAPVQSSTTSFMMVTIPDRPYLDDGAFDSNGPSSVIPDSGSRKKTTPKKSTHIIDQGIKPSVHIW